jgi:hypothetical protein
MGAEDYRPRCLDHFKHQRTPAGPSVLPNQTIKMRSLMEITATAHDLPQSLLRTMEIARRYVADDIWNELTFTYTAPPTHPEEKGRYDHVSRTIYVNPVNASGMPHLTFLHELGHAVDALLPGYAKTSPGQHSFAPVSSLEQAKIDYQNQTFSPENKLLMLLAAFLSRPQIQDHAEKINQSTDLKVKADLTPAELFARGFCQYVIERSQDSELLRDLQTTFQKPHELDRLLQWAPDDFAPIARSYDELFKS